MSTPESVENTSGNAGVNSVDSYGFRRGEEFDYEYYKSFISAYNVTLNRRSGRWSGVLKNGAIKQVPKSSRIKRFCRKGIPAKHRAQVWMDVSGASLKMKQQPGLYQKTLATEPNLDTLTETQRKNLQQLEPQIELDTKRTFPENIYFNNCSTDDDKKLELSNVLKAAGRLHPDVGYSQGFNYIVGMLLLVTKDEEKAFWLFMTLLDDILPYYHNNTMNEIAVEFQVLGQLVSERVPDVGSVIDHERDFNPYGVITMKWFVCLFVDILPIETLLRVWDCMFYEGSKIIMRTALYLMMLRGKHVVEQVEKARQRSVKNPLSMQQSYMEQISKAFRKLDAEPAVVDCQSFIENMFKATNPMKRSKIQQLRAKEEEKVSEENAKVQKRREERAKQEGRST